MDVDGVEENTQAQHCTVPYKGGMEREVACKKSSDPSAPFAGCDLPINSKIIYIARSACFSRGIPLRDIRDDDGDVLDDRVLPRDRFLILVSAPLAFRGAWRPGMNIGMKLKLDSRPHIYRQRDIHTCPCVPSDVLSSSCS